MDLNLSQALETLIGLDFIVSYGNINQYGFKGIEDLNNVEVFQYKNVVAEEDDVFVEFFVLSFIVN